MNEAVYHATVRRLGYEPVGAATCPCPSCQGARHPAPPAPALPELAPALARVLGLPLAQLDRVLRVAVPWLPGPLWFVPTEVDAEVLVAAGEASRGAVWTRRELLDLLAVPGITKDQARTVARAKLAVGGEVVEVRPARASAPGAATWPAALPALGPRRVGTFSRCADCPDPAPTIAVPLDDGTRLDLPGPVGTFVAYGDRPLCLACARRRAAESAPAPLLPALRKEDPVSEPGSQSSLT